LVIAVEEAKGEFATARKERADLKLAQKELDEKIAKNRDLVEEKKIISGCGWTNTDPQMVVALSWELILRLITMAV
jgi:hypothetical protein